MIKKIFSFFDKVEDNIRGSLSHYPITYALISGIGIVLFWRGVWHTADIFPFMTGPVSLLISIIILLSTGLFVSFFVGENIFVAGIRREKKLVEKLESSIETEKEELDDIRKNIRSIDSDIKELKEIVRNVNKSKGAEIKEIKEIVRSADKNEKEEIEELKEIVRNPDKKNG